MNELLNNKLNNLLKIWLVDNTVTVENTTNRHCHFYVGAKPEAGGGSDTGGSEGGRGEVPDPTA